MYTKEMNLSMEEGFEKVFKILEDFENPDTVNELLKEIQEN